MPDISKTDLQKVLSYLDDAARLYDALPMQKCKCRAHMIRLLVARLKARLSSASRTTQHNHPFNTYKTI